MSASITDNLESADLNSPHPFRVEALDYFPLVSTISGVARVVFGTVQAAVGLVLFPIQLCGRIVNYKTPFILGHGIANIVRGCVATVPVFGNISLYIYDHTRFV